MLYHLFIRFLILLAIDPQIFRLLSQRFSTTVSILREEVKSRGVDFFFESLLIFILLTPPFLNHSVAPPYVFAVICAMISAYASDRMRVKIPFILFNAVMVIVGLCLVAFVHHTPANPMVAARYAGVFLGVFGCNSNVAFTLGQANASIVGQSKRGYTSALQVMAGGIGGIIASTVFRSKDAPNYRMGIWVAVGAQALVVLIQIGLFFFFRIRNQQARSGKKLIEKTPGFYYTL